MKINVDDKLGFFSHMKKLLKIRNLIKLTTSSLKENRYFKKGTTKRREKTLNRLLAIKKYQHSQRKSKRNNTTVEKATQAS
jgi:hypothetical protein